MLAPRSLAEVCDALTCPDEFSFGPWQVDQASALVAAWTDAEIARWNPVPPNPTLELAEGWIRSTASQNEASVGIDVVMSTPSKVVVGEVGLQIDPSQAIGEVGFWVAASHRGIGAGKELLAIAEQLGAALELRGLVALVDADNEAALALLASRAWPEIPTKSTRRAFAHRVVA